MESFNYSLCIEEADDYNVNNSCNNNETYDNISRVINDSWR
jgi:hypothetical protein